MDGSVSPWAGGLKRGQCVYFYDDFGGWFVAIYVTCIIA